MGTRTVEEVLGFWFGTQLEGGDMPPEGVIMRWFRKDAVFDEAIRRDFGETLALAGAGGLDEWQASPDGAVALVILLDQMTRNLFRDSGEGFSNDARALAVMDAALSAGHWPALADLYRSFLLMPTMHSEDLAVHARGRELFTRARDEARSEGSKRLLDNTLHYMDLHTRIIERFGRYPHRNALLGRATTPEEAAFLEEPDSSF